MHNTKLSLRFYVNTALVSVDTRIAAFHLLLLLLQTAHGEVISRRQNVERMTELQQSKYQDLQAALPSELSMQLAEVALALGSAEDQVTRLLFATTF